MTTIATVRTCEAWCTNHYDGEQHAEDAFCRSERVTIAGYESYLSDGTSSDIPAIFVDNERISVTAARALCRRLAALADMLDPPAGT